MLGLRPDAVVRHRSAARLLRVMITTTGLLGP